MPDRTPHTLYPEERPVAYCHECPFQIVCPTATQLIAVQLKREGKLASHLDCVWHDRLSHLIWKEFGAGTSIPRSVEGLRLLLKQNTERLPLGTDPGPDPWEVE